MVSYVCNAAKAAVSYAFNSRPAQALIEVANRVKDAAQNTARNFDISEFPVTFFGAVCATKILAMIRDAYNGNEIQKSEAGLVGLAAFLVLANVRSLRKVERVFTLYLETRTAAEQAQREVENLRAQNLAILRQEAALNLENLRQQLDTDRLRQENNVLRQVSVGLVIQNAALAQQNRFLLVQHQRRELEAGPAA